MSAQEDKISSPSSSYQRQTILSLYSSGIDRDVIAQQLDIEVEEIDKVIAEEEQKTNKEQQPADTRNSNGVSSIGNSFYLDAIVNIDFAIGNAQTRMWKALKSGGVQFDISMDETDKILRKFSRSKVTFVILHIDLVGSTQLSMTLPLDRLITIIQTFIQEMSTVIALYGGYVLKYIGDAILAFFITNSDGSNRDNNPQKQQLYLPCVNAINCARSMIKVIENGINPILNQYDYPEMSIRVGIDVGKTALIQYGWDIHVLDGKQIVKEPHHDILGYTVNVAVKMTSLAKPNGLVIGQSVYDILDEKQKSTFELLKLNSTSWNYRDEKTGNIYHVYSAREQ